MMKDNDLLMVVIAFVIGFMLQGMMKNMCGQRRLKEGNMFGDIWGNHRSMDDEGYQWDNEIQNFSGKLRDRISGYETVHFDEQPLYEDTPDEGIFLPGSTYM